VQDFLPPQPDLAQSGEILRKILDLFNALDRLIGVTAERSVRLEPAYGSRILSLLGTEGSARCFSGVARLIIDDAVLKSIFAFYQTTKPGSVQTTR
jgi:hypothetical protein